MRVGSLDVPAGGLDLTATLESGQTFLWERIDGGTYDQPPTGGTGRSSNTGWYATTEAGTQVQVRLENGTLQYRAAEDAPADLGQMLQHRLGLTDDLQAIARAAPSEDLVTRAFDRHSGLRLVREPFFPTLVSFICSAQMRVERIFRMVQGLRRAYGRPTHLAGTQLNTFPTATRLANAAEEELRALKLGYRAPYVRDAAGQVATGELVRADIKGLDYEAARDAATGYVGVGPKVADCVLLFALGDWRAVPLDTWIRSAIADTFPACDRDGYAATSRAIRDRLGPDIAGYVQTYVFHDLRTRDRLESATD